MWKRSRHPSDCANASCSSAVGRCLSSAVRSRKYTVGPAVPCVVTMIMWCDKHLSLSTMHGGSESQSQHNIQHLCDYLTACGNIFGFWMSCLARLLSTHTPQRWNTPLEKATTNEEGLEKNNAPPPLKIALSGGNARPRGSSPLCGVGGVSGLGPGYSEGLKQNRLFKMFPSFHLVLS